MGEPVPRTGHPDLPTPNDADAALAEAAGGVVTRVDWCARRRLPPDDVDVVVYRGRVERAEYDAYYAVLGWERPLVFPAVGYDSMVKLVAAFQAHRHAD